MGSSASALSTPLAPLRVYLLELAGSDDRFARGEAAVAAEGLSEVAPGVALAEGLDRDRARHLAFTRAISDHLVTATGDRSRAVAAVDAIAFDRTGSVAVRARDVRGRAGVDTVAVEREVGAVLDAAGFTVDLEAPDHELRVIAVADDGTIRWLLGWLLVEPDRGFGARRPPERPFRQPGTMQPQLARAVVNLSGVAPGERFLDPMCGPGAMLIEAGRMGIRPIGIDYQRRMVEGATRNYAALAADSPPLELIRASADALPLTAVDAVAFDAPYGRQSPIGHTSATALVGETLEALLPVVDRVVAVFDRPIADLADGVGWTVVDRFDRRVHRSLTRHVTVLKRPP